MHMTTNTRHVGYITIVDISGRFVLGKDSASVRDMIYDLLSKGDKQILHNLGVVDYIDTRGLGSLVGAFLGSYRVQPNRWVLPGMFKVERKSEASTTQISSRKLGVQLAGSNSRTKREQNPPNTP